MTKLVIRVRLSRHHAASEASQGPIDLQLRSNSLSSLTCICAFTVFHLNNSLHDSSTIALLPVFNMPYTKLNWLFLPVLDVPVVLCMVGIEKLKLPVMYNINEMTGWLYCKIWVALLSRFGVLKSTIEYSFCIHTFRQHYNWGRYVQCGVILMKVERKLQCGRLVSHFITVCQAIEWNKF